MRKVRLGVLSALAVAAVVVGGLSVSAATAEDGAPLATPCCKT